MTNIVKFPDKQPPQGQEVRTEIALSTALLFAEIALWVYEDRATADFMLGKIQQAFQDGARHVSFSIDEAETHRKYISLEGETLKGNIMQLLSAS